MKIYEKYLNEQRGYIDYPSNRGFRFLKGQVIKDIKWEDKENLIMTFENGNKMIINIEVPGAYYDEHDPELSVQIK